MATDTQAWQYIRKQGRMLLMYVGVPLIVLILLAIVLLYAFGGAELLRFTLARLFTWGGINKAVVVIVGLAGITWLRHVIWFADEPPPIWLKRSGWVNVFEGLLLLAIVAIGAWAILRFGTPLR